MTTVVDSTLVKRMLVIGGARTGVLMSKFGDMHEYIEELMGRPVFTHEMGDKVIATEIREKAKAPFEQVIDELLVALDEGG